MKRTKSSWLIVILCLLLTLCVFASCNDTPSVDNSKDSDEIIDSTPTSDNAVDKAGDQVTDSTPTSDTEPEEEEDLSKLSNEQLLARIAKKIENSDNYTIFTIGDSVTYGYKTSGNDFTYTAQFAKMLGEQLKEKTIIRYDGDSASLNPPLVYENPTTVQTGTTDEKITVVRSGVCGDTIKLIIDRQSDFINKEIDGKTGDLFIISTGINDAGINGPKYVPLTEYKTYLKSLVATIKENHPNADVIFMTPTYFGSTGKPLDPYAKRMTLAGAELHVGVIDLHKLWMDHWVEGAEHYGQGDWLTTDDCHPSDIACVAMAEEMMHCLFGNK